MEGYPAADFLSWVVPSARRRCANLVPDMYAIDVRSRLGHRTACGAVASVIAQLNDLGIRVSLFVDADYPALEWAREVGAARVELYTERLPRVMAASEAMPYLKRICRRRGGHRRWAWA